MSNHEDWLKDEIAEYKLSEVASHEMLLTEFQARLAKIREDDPDYRPWVVPFCYTHEDAEERMKFKGGLWIPDMGVQRQVDYAGHFLHYTLIEDLEMRVEFTGIELVGYQIQTRISNDGPVPVVYAHPSSLVATMEHVKLQTENDFGVSIQSY